MMRHTICGSYKLMTLIVLMQLIHMIGADETVECSGMDVRNNVRRFKKLENCSVIKGDLSIVLMEWTVERDFQNVTFPKLKEITGFLLVFRVFGLKSVGSLFPNLVVIRGHNLLTNYALIVYGNKDLQEIGLRALISIQRGSVRIGDCPILCYSSTIDWAKITGGDTNYIATSETIQCPTTKSCRGCVPANCWSSKACQRSDTGFNFAGTIKCHDECLSGCVNKTARGCTVCRHAVDDGLCVSKCKGRKVLHANSYRCITKEDCYQRGWIVFDGQCVQDCPTSYRLKNSFDESYDMLAKPVCVLCESNCPKICKGREVTYLSDTDIFRGCTIVNGSLQIRFIEDVHNIMEELEKNLGDIEEVYGLLKIYRSVTLSSLGFFRSLHTIHGQALEMKKYSFIVYENNNLQTLWDPRSKQEIELKNGNMLFTANSKLCLHEIQLLQSIVAYNGSCGKKCDFVSQNTNGYMASCIMEPIFSEANVTSFENVTIRWKAYKSKGQQTIVGYTIFYIEAPQTNITSYYGQDSCSSYSWHSEFVAVEDLKTYKGLFTYQITNLTQFTQYAYYVRTSIIQSDPISGKNGQSEVRYFKTFADQPSAPIDVFTISKSSDSITLGWAIKPEEKEIVDHFTIDVLIQPDISHWYNQRDICLYPLLRDSVRTVEDSNSDECCCAASDSSNSDQELIFQLHSTGGTEVSCELDVWAPECESLEYRHKRSAQSPEPPFNIEKSFPELRFTNFYDAIENLARNPPGRQAVLFPNRSRRDIEQYKNYVGTYIIRHGQNITLGSLNPFTTYIFQVFAWGQSNLSSPYFLYHEHTNALHEADNVHLEVSNVGQNNLVELLIWLPAHPNGAILGFNIEYKRLDQLNETSKVLCVSRKNFLENKFVYTLHNLTMGLYEVRVCGHSLAGRGIYTEWQPFRIIVPTQPPPDHKIRDVLITLGVVVVVILAILLVYFWHKKRQSRHRHDDKIVLVEEF